MTPNGASPDKSCTVSLKCLSAIFVPQQRIMWKYKEKSEGKKKETN
jgi:hypothetical protein